MNDAKDKSFVWIKRGHSVRNPPNCIEEISVRASSFPYCYSGRAAGRHKGSALLIMNSKGKGPEDLRSICMVSPPPGAVEADYLAKKHESPGYQSELVVNNWNAVRETTPE